MDIATEMIHLCLLASCLSVMSLQESVLVLCKRRILGSKQKNTQIKSKLSLLSLVSLKTEQCKDLSSLKTALFSSITLSSPCL